MGVIRNSVHPLLVILLTAFPSACGEAPEGAGEGANAAPSRDSLAPGAPSDSPSLPVSRRHARHALMPLGETRNEIVGRLGEPDSVSLEAVPNRHVPGQTDTLVTLHYPGLRARIYQVTDGRVKAVRFAFYVD